MSPITLDDIDAAENAVKNVRVKLNELGRAIHLARHGKPLGSEYAFDGYTRQNYAGSHYYEQEGPDWGVGTPILSLRFYWPRAEDVRVVTLPLRYLCCDWRAEEAGRLEAERQANAEIARKHEEEMVRAGEERDRREFERLTAKYSPTTPDEGGEVDRG